MVSVTTHVIDITPPLDSSLSTTSKPVALVTPFCNTLNNSGTVLPCTKKATAAATTTPAYTVGMAGIFIIAAAITTTAGSKVTKLSL